MVRWQTFLPGFSMALVGALLVVLLALANPRAAALPTFDSGDFAGSGNCDSCHNEGMVDEANNPVGLVNDWRGTMMANSARDPLWQARVSVEISRTVSLRNEIEDTCAICHMPMARTQAVANGTTVAIFDDGFLSPANGLHLAAMDGVSCTLCHQITNGNFSAPGDGNFVIDTSTTTPDRAVYGPFDNLQTMPMRNQVGFTPTYSPHVTRAALCGTCHNLTTHAVRADGTLTGDVFPEQRTYDEWEASRFGDGQGGDDLSCQACHMPTAVGGVRLATTPNNLAPRQPFHRHTFTGANVFMLRLLRDNLDALGVPATPAQMNETITRTQTFLQEATARLIVQPILQGDVLTLTVQVQNLTGHKFPSGYPSRRAWLHVVVTDTQGTRVFESGAPLADGRIAGNDADADPTTYEPHYDVITSTAQVQIYEPVMLDSDGKVTYTLLRAASYAKDNRLLPQGFDKANAPADIAVRGAAAADANFVAGGDIVTYRIAGNGSGLYHVRVEMLYQTLSYPFAQDVLSTVTPKSAAFGGYYAAADRTPLRVAEEAFVIGAETLFLPLVER